MEANCYIIGCRETGEAAVVDPGAEAGRILSRLEQLKLKCRCIILTHGHADHIGALAAVKEATGAAVLIHREDAGMLTSPARNLSLYVGQALQLEPADRLLEEGDEIKVGSLTLKVLHTPGHTPGGICLQLDGYLITGDTLFAGSVGRSDFPGGDHRQLIASIKKKLLVFPPETQVLPGHGPASTIGEESRDNPFLNGRLY
ncbi:MBL fold metallo-hydrolase [Desulfotomaculum copahuensis]|uniref:MBL fold metallo-hydrolase n=1 Tax=Desulfotomaculum copahuensis TaxID=1838280 RepID=A0A1B7LGC6_9FIRM|nr:MBL fold metallo-hydrolase [Desulfotomaculum copahuensis]OAT85028.1 MBL fold metallo-hydrolase [Desulfotomaculum copahuensis]